VAFELPPLGRRHALVESGCVVGDVVEIGLVDVVVIGADEALVGFFVGELQTAAVGGNDLVVL